MDLAGIVSPLINAINPDTIGKIMVSTGKYTTDSDGTRTPAYDTVPNVSLQVQAASTDDLKMIDSLNIQGVKHVIYIHGQYNAIVRPQNKGGDLVIIDDGGPYNGTWKIVVVLEQWPDWCKVAVTLQNNP